MPLPTRDPVAFRGVPSLGGNKKMAFTVTFTQKQVEAMFQRHDALRAQGSSQCPLEIDFDDNKIYIGEMATAFTRVQEHGTREICQRSPTVSKPLAGIMLAGNVIGKLNMQRDYDPDVADNIKKRAEAEASKRKERHIVRLDSPPIISNGKKSKPGSGTTSLAIKAMKNRSRTSVPSAPTSTPVSSKSSNTRQHPPDSSTRSVSSNPSTRTSQSLATSSTTEVDLTTLRSHMIHYLAFEPRMTRDVLLKLGGPNPSSESVQEIEETLTKVAEEVRQPKNSAPRPVSWQLLPRSWQEIRPYEYGSLSDEDRKKLARKGRLALSSTVDQSDPLWDHLRSDVDPSAVSSQTKSKAKESTGTSAGLVKTSDFKGGMFQKEKKPTTKSTSTANGGSTKKKVATTKSRAKKEQEEEKEFKARKGVATPDEKRKGKADLGSSASMKSGSMEDVDKVEDEVPPGTKLRQSSATVKKVVRRPQVEISSLKRKRDEDGYEMEESEPSSRLVRKRKAAAGASQSNKTPPSASKIVEKEQGTNGESITPMDGGDVTRGSSGGLQSKVSSLPGSKALKEKEQEREALEVERREHEKRRSGKRARRATPSFSSDEDEVETKPVPASLRSTNAKASAQSSAPLKSTTTLKPPRAPSPAFPTDKEGLRRRYRTYYDRYMGVTFKLHEQLSKIETALETAGDGASVDEDVEMMDTEQLLQLRGEHERLRDELGRIQRAHAIAY